MLIESSSWWEEQEMTYPAASWAMQTLNYCKHHGSTSLSLEVVERQMWNTNVKHHKLLLILKEEMQQILTANSCLHNAKQKIMQNYTNYMKTLGQALTYSVYLPAKYQCINLKLAPGETWNLSQYDGGPISSGFRLVFKPRSPSSEHTIVTSSGENSYQ